tara:strand:- start:3741 stop:4328 length:588 start_codon:yes stop_codon:yes gene_type:complete
MSEEGQDEEKDETSMDDILANIRRVISEEDDEAASETTNDPKVDVTEEESEEVIETAAGTGTDEPDSEIDLTKSEQNPIQNPTETENFTPPPLPLSGEDDVLELTEAMIAPADELMSGRTTQTSSDVLGELARAIMERRELGLGDKDVTLEGMVREMLRPLLREWLDRNLPYLIERLVKKEIDKMVNRAEMFEEL